MTVQSSSYSVVRSTNPESVRQDGYMAVGNSGAVLESLLEVSSLITSFTWKSTGTWQVTFAHTWPTAVPVTVPPFPTPNPVTNGSPLLQFIVTPVYTGSPGASVLQFACGSDNLNTNTTDGSGILTFYFLNDSGSLTDLPPDGGFRYSVVLQASSLYL